MYVCTCKYTNVRMIYANTNTVFYAYNFTRVYYYNAHSLKKSFQALLRKINAIAAINKLTKEPITRSYISRVTGIPNIIQITLRR